MKVLEWKGNLDGLQTCLGQRFDRELVVWVERASWLVTGPNVMIDNEGDSCRLTLRQAKALHDWLGTVVEDFPDA